jgi:hypothetical protein
MLIDPPSVQQLSNVISLVTGPAFLLAAEAQLLAVLVARLDRIVDNSQLFDSLESEEVRTRLKQELPVLEKRARLMHKAIYWGVASCVVTSLLVIVSFLAAFLHVRHEYGAATLFAVAMALFTGALIAFGQEVRLNAVEINRVAATLRKHAGK